MKRTAIFSMFVAVAVVASWAFAQGKEHHEVVHAPPPRAVAPTWKAHPPGAHPHGPIVRPHQVRVLAPKVYVHGAHDGWRHWEHPEFLRPYYYWNWTLVHQVSCTAEDSYGDQYPVTETTGPGWGLENMTAVEDDALDRCYSESGSDESCYLVNCSHF
jgi:hypothetical protein